METFVLYIASQISFFREVPGSPCPVVGEECSATAAGTDCRDHCRTVAQGIKENGVNQGSRAGLEEPALTGSARGSMSSKDVFGW